MCALTLVCGSVLVVVLVQGTALETDLYNARMYLLRCEGVFKIARFTQRHWRGTSYNHHRVAPTRTDSGCLSSDGQCVQDGGTFRVGWHDAGR